MKQFKELMKVSFLSAIGIVLPLILLLVLFEKIVALLGGITTPFARVLFPAQFADHVVAARLATFVLLLGVSLILGFLAQTKWGQQTGHWIEDNTFMRLKVYRGLKDFSDRLVPSQTEFLFQPALLIREDEMNTFVFIVEDIGEDHVVIFAPSVPSTFSGSLAIVPREDVRILNVPVMDVVRVFSRWGVGTEKIMSDLKLADVLQGKEKIPRQEGRGIQYRG